MVHIILVFVTQYAFFYIRVRILLCVYAGMYVCMCISVSYKIGPSLAEKIQKIIKEAAPADRGRPKIEDGSAYAIKIMIVDWHSSPRTLSVRPFSIRNAYTI